MGFDPYKKNEISDLSSDAKLKAVNPLMAKKVTPTDVTPVDVSGANVGGGEGEGGVKIAGDLGDFMKANRGNIELLVVSTNTQDILVNSRDLIFLIIIKIEHLILVDILLHTQKSQRAR